MGLTKFPNGVSSFGIPQLGNGLYPANGKTHYWVHGNQGSDGNTGTDPLSPLLTMAKAFTLITSGDVIHFNGNIREQIDTPAGVFDVTVIGEGTRPRHADAHTGNNGYQTATWKPPASPTATTPLVRVRQQGWRFTNILWVPPTDCSAIRCFRDGGAGDAERDGSHMHVFGCRFAGGQDAIEAHGGPAFLKIEGNFFMDQTRNSIMQTTGAGIGTNHRWDINDNRFSVNVNHIVAALDKARIIGNTFGSFTTMAIDLNGGAGLNIIYNNFLSGTYSVAGGYRKANANDDWGGNWNTGVGVLTTADPA